MVPQNGSAQSLKQIMLESVGIKNRQKNSKIFAFFGEFWYEKAPKMHPLNLQNHGFHSEGIQNPGFSRFLENTPKRTSRDPPGEAKWRPKSLRGGLKTMKNGPRTFLGPPRPEPVNFFSPPEASRSTPGTIFKASWQPPGAHWVPR